MKMKKTDFIKTDPKSVVATKLIICSITSLCGAFHYLQEMSEEEKRDFKWLVEPITNFMDEVATLDLDSVKLPPKMKKHAERSNP